MKGFGDFLSQPFHFLMDGKSKTEREFGGLAEDTRDDPVLPALVCCSGLTPQCLSMYVRATWSALCEHPRAPYL